jgi:hypothetical protein
MSRGGGSRILKGALGAVVCVLWCGGALAAPPAAAPTSEADALIKRGNDLRRNRDDQGAFPLLQRAYQLQPGPRTAVQLGLVEQALGRWAEADEHLTIGLRGTTDPWIQHNRKIIDVSIHKVKLHVARIEITGEPTDAEVTVNGRSVGKVPLTEPVRVAEGSVDVELRAPGYKRGFRTVTVRAGQYQPVVIRLERDAPPAEVHPPPLATLTPALPPNGNVPVSGPALATPAPVAPDVTAAPEDHPTPRWRPWAIGGALTGAAIGAGVGVFGMVRHDSKVAAFNERSCLETSHGVLRSPATQDEGCVNLNTDYRNARIISVIGFAAAGALAATALVLYLTAPDAPPPGETAMASVACAPDVVHPGLACAVRF